jgi:hypothetical protein
MLFQIIEGRGTVSIIDLYLELLSLFKEIININGFDPCRGEVVGDYLS